MSKKSLIILIIGLFVLIGLLLLIRGEEDTWLCVDGDWVKHGVPRAPKPTKPCGEKIITNFFQCAELGYLVLESYPRQCRTPDGQIFIEDIGNELGKTDLISVSRPRPNEAVSSPLIIEGQARGTWFFEASFPIKLFDAQNNLIATAIAQAQSDWMTEDFVPFQAELNFTALATETGILILEKDNPSDLPENADELRIPVYLQRIETLTVKLFFGNSQLDPEVLDCAKNFSVERTIAKTPAVARVALAELLKGPTEAEKNQGFFTSINQGVKIQKLTIENGVAKVDFDETLERGVGGSCRVAAIASQIRETLKQFPTVSEVVISIDGRTEDILQP